MPAPRARPPLLLTAALALASCHHAPARPTTVAVTAEPTARHPVVDRYHDVAVTDDYQWLEETDAPVVRAWVAARLPQPAPAAVPPAAAAGAAAPTCALTLERYLDLRELLTRGGGTVGVLTQLERSLLKHSDLKQASAHAYMRVCA